METLEVSLSESFRHIPLKLEFFHCRKVEKALSEARYVEQTDL